MFASRLLPVLSLLSFSPSLWAQPLVEKEEVRAQCVKMMQQLNPDAKAEAIAKLCDRAEKRPDCSSVKGVPIPHFNFPDPNPSAKRILAFSLIHGDEELSGKMVSRWANRLMNIEHRNNWRIVPMLNPDGFANKTRTNSQGVDLNRNFPTKDWNDDAVKNWRKSAASEKRRYPGPEAASEPETKCALDHIRDFRPDFIVSIHTPYNVLDFDGPRLNFPPYKPIPWRTLGNFPGSLGRFMWKDHQVPVLTVELKETLVNPDALQDMVGTFAIRSTNLIGKRTSPIDFDSLMPGPSATNRNPASSPKQAEL